MTMSTRIHRSFIVMLVFLIATAFLSFIVGTGGCTDQQVEAYKQQMASLTMQVNTQKEQLQPLLDQKTALQKALDDARAQITAGDSTPEAKAKAQTMLDDYQSKLTKLNPTIDKINGVIDSMTKTLNTLNDQVQAAGNGWDIAAANVRAGGNAAAPLSGPYQPIVLLSTNLLASVLTLLGTKKYFTNKGAAAVAVPIEAARNDALEATIDNGSGKYLVVEKEAANIVHEANGVAGVIQAVTS